MGIAVDEPSGDRWDAGLALLLEGTGGVGLPGVLIVRWTAGLDPDPRINVQVSSRLGPRLVTLRPAKEDVAHSRRVIHEALGADERLRAAFEEFGVFWELVFDQGERGTSLRLAAIHEDGSLEWDEGMRPGV